MRDLRIKDVQVVQNIKGTEKIPVSNGSGKPATITINLILDEVDNKIGEVINGAPETLDTLKEIADIIENNADIIESVANKVDREELNSILFDSKFVDLDLPSGIKWATCNLGATKPEEIGLYYAWGETQGYSAKDVQNGVRRFSANEYTVNKYNESLTTLKQIDDAAYLINQSMRLPSPDEYRELINNTTIKFVENYNNSGVNGLTFTSKKNTKNFIFIPLSGSASNGVLERVNTHIYLWANEVSQEFAYYLISESGWCDVNNYNARSKGMNIRPVQDKDLLFNPDDHYTKEELDNAIDITYSELVELRNNELLRTGACYKITDYETMVNENLSNTSDLNYLIPRTYFKLIVRAISNKELDQRAFATDSTHTYFTNEIMSKWLIWYSLDNDTNLYPLANANGKGIIYRFIDERSNDVNFDFRSITYYCSVHKETGNTQKAEFSLFTKYDYIGDDNTILFDYLTDTPCKNNTVRFLPLGYYLGSMNGARIAIIYGDYNTVVNIGGNSVIQGNHNIMRYGTGGNYAIGNYNNFEDTGGSFVIGDHNIITGPEGGNRAEGNGNIIFKCGGASVYGNSNKLYLAGGCLIKGNTNIINSGYALITGGNNLVKNSYGTFIEGNYNNITECSAAGTIKGDYNKVHYSNVTLDGDNNDISGSEGQNVTGNYNKISGGSGGNTINGNNNTITGDWGGNKITGNYNVATQTNCVIVGNSNNVTNGGGHRVEGNLNMINTASSLVFGDVNEINSPDLGAFFVYGSANKFEPRTASITVYGSANKFEPACTDITLGDSDSPFNNCRILTGTKNVKVIDRLNRGGISNVTINLPRQKPTSGSLEILNVYPEKYNENQHSGTSTITFDDNGNIIEYTPEDFLQLNKRRFTMIVDIPEDLVGKEINLVAAEIGYDYPDIQRLFVDDVEVKQDATKSKSYYTFTTVGEHKVTIWFDLDTTFNGYMGGINVPKTLDFTGTDLSNSVRDNHAFFGRNYGKNCEYYIFKNTIFKSYIPYFGSGSPEVGTPIKSLIFKDIIFTNPIPVVVNRFCDQYTEELVMDCDVSHITFTDAFKNVTTNGTFYYNGKYDFSSLLSQLPETWVAIDLNTGLKYRESIVTDNAIDVDAEDGVYILDSNNNLVTTSEWNTENTALGVAVIDGVNKFVIAKLDATEEAVNWGEDEIDSSLRNYVTVESAATDINGVYNTSKLYKNTTSAASYCGGNSYLGSAGEWISVLNNLDTVNAALELIEGQPLDAESYWTSTECDAEQAWRITPAGLEPSNSLSMVRPFIALGAPLTTRVKLLELKVLNIPDMSNFATKDEIPTDYITEIPAEYVTEDELTAKGYLTEHQDISNLVTLSELAAMLSDLQSYTNSAISNLLDSAPDTLNTLNELAIAITEHQEVTDALDAAITDKQDVISDLDDIRNGASAGATAVQPEAISDMETKTNAAATYQPIGEYALKSELPTDYLTTIPEADIDTLGGVKKITVDTLADDADITTVVTAYNNLINKLIESGLATTLLDA